MLRLSEEEVEGHSMREVVRNTPLFALNAVVSASSTTNRTRSIGVSSVHFVSKHVR